ncbi:MAG: nucleoid occlusion factor SlmA [Kangiellaceae bacterium]
MTAKKSDRKQDILQSLALMLEEDLSERITTARLAKHVGVSEAALYRHFPSKARMYESLLDFSEESVFAMVNKISQSDLSGLEQCQRICKLILGFSQKNPGISRLLMGEVLLGETQRLKARVSQFFDKVETQIKQVLRDDAIKDNRSTVESAAYAKLLTSIIEGRLQQFVRSQFKYQPMDNWDAQWNLILKAF